MDETRLFNTFIDYFDQLTDSKITEGCIGINHQETIVAVNVGIATALTINKILKEIKS